MISTVSMYDFERAFTESRPNSFSYEGLKALFEYLEEYEDSTGEQVELDVIALCCDYTEYENLAEFWDNYDKEDYPDIEAIHDETIVIEIDGSEGFIIQQF